MSRDEPLVLFVTGEYPPRPGGIADYTHHLRLALAGIGVPSRVVTTGAALDVDVTTLARWSWGTPGGLRRIAREVGAGVVHIQYQAGAFGMHPALNAVPALLRRSGIPVVVTFHDLRPPYLFPKAGRLRGWSLLRMARAARGVVVTNPADERQLTRRGIDVTRVPIGPSLPPPGAVTPDDGVVAYFGFASRSKGIEDLVVALGALDAARRPELLLVGESGTPTRNNDVVGGETLEKLAREHGVRLRRTGHLPAHEASAALAGAGAIVLPFRDGATLRSSTLPAVVQTGRPVVTTAPRDLDGLGELRALPQLTLVPPGDTRALAGAIARALASTTPAAPLPEAHRWQAIARCHRELYHRVAGDRR